MGEGTWCIFAKQVLPGEGTSQPLWWEAASAPGLRGWQALTSPPALS